MSERLKLTKTQMALVKELFEIHENAWKGGRITREDLLRDIEIKAMLGLKEDKKKDYNRRLN